MTSPSHIECLPLELRLIIYEILFDKITINALAIAQPASRVRTYASLRAVSRLFRDEVSKHVRSRTVAVYYDKDDMLFTLKEPSFEHLISQFSKVTMQFGIGHFADALFSGKHSLMKWWTGRYPRRFYETYHFEESDLTLALGRFINLHSLRLAFPNREASRVIAESHYAFRHRLLADIKRCSSAEWLLRLPNLCELLVVDEFEHDDITHHPVIGVRRRPLTLYGGK